MIQKVIDDLREFSRVKEANRVYDRNNVDYAFKDFPSERKD